MDKEEKRKEFVRLMKKLIKEELSKINFDIKKDGLREINWREIYDKAEEDEKILKLMEELNIKFHTTEYGTTMIVSRH